MSSTVTHKMDIGQRRLSELTSYLRNCSRLSTGQLPIADDKLRTGLPSICRIEMRIRGCRIFCCN